MIAKGNPCYSLRSKQALGDLDVVVYAVVPHDIGVSVLGDTDSHDLSITVSNNNHQQV